MCNLVRESVVDLNVSASSGHPEHNTMAFPNQSNRTNKDLLKALRGPHARFYPFDLHTHTIASHDVCHGEHFFALPQSLRESLEGTLPLVVPITEASSPKRVTPTRPALPLPREPVDRQKHDLDVSIPEFVEAYYAQLVARRDATIGEDAHLQNDKWCLIAITDHDTACFSTKLSQLAWDQRSADQVIVLPGLELETHFEVEGRNCALHILCIFAPATTFAHISVAIASAANGISPGWDHGRSIRVTDLPAFIKNLRSHDSYPAVCVAAHVWSNKGALNEPKKIIMESLQAEIARLTGVLVKAKEDNDRKAQQELSSRLEHFTTRLTPDQLQLDVLQLIGKCGFDGLQVRDQSQERHYRKLHRFRESHGRAVPIICSDAHTPEAIFNCDGNLPFIKLDVNLLRSGTKSDVFEHFRKRALRFGETRTTYSEPGRVSHWIEGIEIVPDAKDARQFWYTTESKETRFTLALSRNLNCLVGGRGSGKSSLIEALAFLCNPKEFDQQYSLRPREKQDWYKRAEATLRGCRLRLVWKTTLKDGFGIGNHRTMFVSRYFDSLNGFQAAEIRDINEDTVVDSAACIPSVQLLRAHQIELTAESTNLRHLFDELCGKEIIGLSQTIEDLRNQLAVQRKRIVDLCKSIMEIARDGGPLRQFGIRKKQFDTANQPEMVSRYEEVDKAEVISTDTSTIHQNWNRLDALGTLREVKSNIVAFFESAEQIATDENGVAKSGYEKVYSVIRTSRDEETPGPREIVVGAVASAETLVHLAGTALKDADDVAKLVLTDCRDVLASAGLPSGSSERESKKRAFIEAKSAFESYATKMNEFQALMRDREVIFLKLVESSKARTQTRKVHADGLSARLRRDLDQEVLQIEVRANELQEKGEFQKWLDESLTAVFRTGRPARINVLLARGLMPRELRELLHQADKPNLDLLRNEIQKVEDGKITSDDCDKLYFACRSLQRDQLDEASTWNVEFTKDLPSEIQDGLVVFPSVDTRLAIDRVLELDEIVLDDHPNILLNDRPKDPDSAPRPLQELSPGQRCSAILPLLLLSGDYPLIIDQPEENLDNRLIRQVIVNILATMKLRRQIIIATHNPNLPVLGDAEQCVVLQARGRDTSELTAQGSLDSPEVTNYITEIMEGGREAFQYRQSIYQTHWEGNVSL